MILERHTGLKYAVEFTPLTQKDLSTLTKRNGWTFGKRQWEAYLGQSGVFPVKMTRAHHNEIEGIVVYRDQPDIEGLFILWIEGAPKNRNFKGNGELSFDHIAENLFAYVCMCSAQKGYNYFIALQSKGNPVLNAFYKQLGFVEFPFDRYMGMYTVAAKSLVEVYLLEEERG